MRSKSLDLMIRIIDFVDKEYASKGRAPTLNEIAETLHIAKSTASVYIADMAEKGMIKSNFGSRGIITKKMMKTRQETKQVPVVGGIACGVPILAEENIERYIPIPKDFLGNGNFFILQAQGNSMINAGIADGDYVIVRQQETAEIGQIVVALIGEEATLKRYYIDRERRKIRLHPENSRMKDMYYDSITIQGVAIKVIKDLA